MSRLATPRAAVVSGSLILALMIGGAPVAASVRQLTFGSYIGDMVIVVAFGAVGVVVGVRRPDNRMGWMLLGVAALYALNDLGANYSLLDYHQHHGRLPLGDLAVIIEPSWAPTIVLIVLTIVLYPDGRLPSPRWRWPVRWLGVWAAAWALGAYAIAVNAVFVGPLRVTSGGDLYAVDRPTGGWAWWSVVQDVWFTSLVMIAVVWLVNQARGYRRLTGDRRAQQKWIMSGAAACVLGGMGSIVLAGAAIGGPLSLGIAALPVAMGIGILKYRLYEIDRIVSRTVSYALLTALLVGVFVGLVVLTTDVLPFSSSVGVAASTLAAAALFNPLRIRVQRAVDRRFNRSRYDAEATVNAFAARLRDAVDLDAVESDLISTVHRVLQPANASVWIRGRPQ